MKLRKRGHDNYRLRERLRPLNVGRWLRDGLLLPSAKRVRRFRNLLKGRHRILTGRFLDLIKVKHRILAGRFPSLIEGPLSLEERVDGVDRLRLDHRKTLDKVHNGAAKCGQITGVMPMTHRGEILSAQR